MYKAYKPVAFMLRVQQYSCHQKGASLKNLCSVVCFKKLREIIS